MMKIHAKILTLLAGSWLLAACGQSPPPEPAHRAITLGTLLGDADTQGFARVLRPRPFRFPADFGPHPRYRSEWWYFTGTLQNEAGHRFGFELTFFRFALAPRKPADASPWATNQVYMADFAVTDEHGKRFVSWQRFSRGALGLAGAQARPFAVWVGDWSVRRHGRWRPPAHRGQGAADPCGLSGVCGAFPWRLQAVSASARLRLRLTPVQGVILNGRDGLSQKGPAPGEASYYYSMPRLAARGDLRLDGRRYAVSGTVWLDREWSTSSLAANQAGWDWFGLRLDDGADLMFYRLRDRNGRTDPYSAGTWVSPAGGVVPLRAGQVRLEPLAYWTSPAGRRYPVRWRLSVPTLGLALLIRPWLPDQALDHAIPYWEGAVSVSGRRHGHRVRGEGYMELTGYGPDAR